MDTIEFEALLEALPDTNNIYHDWPKQDVNFNDVDLTIYQNPDDVDEYVSVSESEIRWYINDEWHFVYDKTRKKWAVNGAYYRTYELPTQLPDGSKVLINCIFYVSDINT